jgi:predicted GIY-YIG superfamily endonuclease
MNHYIYIIQCQKDGSYFSGHSNNYLKKLEEHNQNVTSENGPWVLRYAELHEHKAEALKREKMFKRQDDAYLEWLFSQPTNVVKTK